VSEVYEAMCEKETQIFLFGYTWVQYITFPLSSPNSKPKNQYVEICEIILIIIKANIREC
jgi:hypothetical protein